MKYYVHCGTIKEILEATSPEEAMILAIENAIAKGKAGFGVIIAVSEKGFFEDLLDAGDETLDEDVQLYPVYLLLCAMGHDDIAEELQEHFNSEEADELIRNIQDEIYESFEEGSSKNITTSDVLA